MGYNNNNNAIQNLLLISESLLGSMWSAISTKYFLNSSFCDPLACLYYPQLFVSIRVVPWNHTMIMPHFPFHHPAAYSIIKLCVAFSKSPSLTCCLWLLNYTTHARVSVAIPLLVLVISYTPLQETHSRPHAVIHSILRRVYRYCL